MRKILVLGGTRFFGKRLVQKLLANGDDVTIATRGETADDFGEEIKRVKVDRFDRKSLEDAFSDGEMWDVIYDQICFSPDDALDACEIFKNTVKKYVLTSTLAVYDFNEKELKEEKDFDPFTYKWKSGRKEGFSYAEGKQYAEAVFFQEANFPVVAPRPPIVFGLDDYTERLHYHVRKVMMGEPIGMDDLAKKLSFVDSEDLGNFLFWIGVENITGPVNASAPDQITLGEIISLIEKYTGKKVTIESPETVGEKSPINFPVSIYQDVSLAKSAGYSFKPLTEWFEPLIKAIVEEETSKNSVHKKRG